MDVLRHVYRLKVADVIKKAADIGNRGDVKHGRDMIQKVIDEIKAADVITDNFCVKYVLSLSCYCCCCRLITVAIGAFDD